MKLLLQSLLLLMFIGSMAYCQTNDSAARARAALALSNSVIEQPKDLKRPTPEVIPAPFNRNSYNPKNGTVWRDKHPKDGLQWWTDPESGLIWRYLRPNEDPATLQVPVIRQIMQAPVMPFRSGNFGSSSNC